MKIKTKPKAIKLVAAVLSFLMISSVLPFFAVTASAESINDITLSAVTGIPKGNNNEGYANLFDGNTGTKWCCEISDSAYVIFKASEPVKLSKYSIATASDTGDFPERNPKEWKLSGCMNYAGADTSWTEIDTVTDGNLPAANETVTDFNIAETTQYYQYFKLEIKKLNGGNTLQISELALKNYTVCDHQFKTTQNIAATCIEDGYNVCECSICHLQKNVPDGTSALDHNFVDEVCTRCGAMDATPKEPSIDTSGVYQIGRASELYWFAGLVNGTLTDGTAQNKGARAVLTADITVNSGLLSSLKFDDNENVTNGNSFESWTPIGYYKAWNDSVEFSGAFDGQGHTISGLYFNDTSKRYLGLFSIIGSGGEIKNVGVIDSYFNGNNFVGGVCGNNYKGTITGCYNTGTVSGNAGVGSVCGSNYGTITGCYNTGTVSGGGNDVGGVCGMNHGTITGCYNTGTVSGSGDYVGGVCGDNYGGRITSCYNTGTVSGDWFVGGVCGYNDGKITGCYSTGTVSGSQHVGGVCGSNRGTITGCYSTGTVSGSGNNYVGGVYGSYSGTITGCYTNRDGDTNYRTDTEFKDGTVCKLLNIALKNENSDVRFYQGANYPKLCVIPKSVNGVYQIGTEVELYWFADKVNNDNANYGNASAVLTADIVVNKGVLKDNGTVADDTSGFTSWTPIGNDSNKYTGKFDGQGHTISGLYFNDTNTEKVGLFGYLGSGGEIKNVGVIDSYFNGLYSVGSVCGDNDGGTITGCYNTGTVSGSGNEVGGVCGYNMGIITGCYNTGTVSGTDCVGGVCGLNNRTITGCYNTGTVSVSGKYVGGVCGYNNNGTLTGCYNTGTVSGNSYRGGVCGRNNSTITGCYTNSGGVCGYDEGNVTACEEKSDTEFKDGTVCKLLNTALQDANSDVRFYQGVKSPEFIRTPELVNGVYQISCATELYGFAQLVNSKTEPSVSAVLTADIVVNKDVLKDDGNLADDTSGFTSWTPIGNYYNRYTGTFDGQGHTINGLYFNDTNTNFGALFGYLGSGGEIKNVGVIDSYFNGNNYIGGVCGRNYGTITGCYNTGTVSGSQDVGGVCGDNYDTMTGCYNIGTVSGSDSVGGVCGDNYKGTITGCYSTGTVSGSGNNVGGVCGVSDGTITACYNTGTVSGKNNVGGVCGYNYKGTITGCYTNNGGVYGYNSNGTVTDCVEYTGDEFINGTVCGLLNTALKNANYEVRFCQRIGTDASPLLTYQFESVDEHTYGAYRFDNNTFKATCFCEQKSEKTMELTLKTEKAVVANGADNTLTATLSNYDNEAVTYKWYQDGVEIHNATSSTYEMPNDLATGKHTYKVEVTMANVGTITQSVDVLVDITPQYIVEIPASVDIGDSFTVSANNVLLKNNAQLKIGIESDFTLSTAKGSLLNYEILNNSLKLTSGDTLLKVAGSENPTAPGSGTSDTYNVALAQGEKPKYSGNYTDTLTFTIKVEP